MPYPLHFSKPWQFSDVVLVVEEDRFHVHRNILGIWSEVFTTMFTSGFKEKYSGEVPLPAITASAGTHIEAQHVVEFLTI